MLGEQIHDGEFEWYRPPLADGVHFPPIEATTTLRRESNGTIRVADKIPLPVNEFGVPDLDKIIDISLATIDRSYEFPISSNRHHLASLARQYHQHPSGSKIPGNYRESGALLARVQVQLHNYWHELYEDSVAPDMDIMIQGFKEQTQITTLSQIGNAALQLERATYIGYKDEGIRELLKIRGKMDARQFKGIYYDFLNSYPEGVVGIFPDKAFIASLPFEQSVREISTRTMPHGMDIRSRVSARLAEVGFRAS